EARIADARRACVSHHRHAFAAAQPVQQFRDAAALVVLVKAHDLSGDPELIEQAPGPAGVLGRDQVRFAEHPQRAPRDVLEIPDRSGYQEQRPSAPGAPAAGGFLFGHSGSLARTVSRVRRSKNPRTVAWDPVAAKS